MFKAFLKRFFKRWLVFFRFRNKFKTRIFKITNFKPKKLTLYKQALNPKLNERMEFLGDTVLSTIVSHYLFDNYPDKDEGFLTSIRSRITNRNMLNRLCKSMGLHYLIRYDSSRKSNAFSYVHGNALEAFIGAIYLEQGYGVCYNFVINKIVEKHVDINKLIKFDDNYKGKLIEWAQKENKTVTFKDELIDKNFVIKLYINDELTGEGVGMSKKVASQLAAKEACRVLSIS